MKRYEWMNELEEHLSALDRSERDKALAFYAELYNDKADSGMTEEEIVSGFGDPTTVADDILRENEQTTATEGREMLPVVEPLEDAPPRESPSGSSVAPSKAGTDQRNGDNPAKPKKHIFLKIVLPILLGIVCLWLLAEGICSIIDFSTRRTEVFTSETAFAVLDLDCEATSVEIRKGDAFGVTYETSVMNTVTVEEQTRDGAAVLKIKQTHFPLGFFAGNTKIVVTVTDRLSEVRLSLDAGSAVFEGLEADTLRADLSAGSLEIRGVTAAVAEIDLSAGSCTAKETTVGNLRANLSAGSLKLDNCSVETSRLRLSAGSIELVRLAVGKSFDADLSAGSLNGSILGSEKDFSISLDISAGSSNIRPSDRDVEKTLTAKLSAGSVNLAFVE